MLDDEDNVMVTVTEIEDPSSTDEDVAEIVAIVTTRSTTKEGPETVKLGDTLFAMRIATVRRKSTCAVSSVTLRFLLFAD